jgi:adenine-specific DNA-methyltransferase
MAENKSEVKENITKLVEKYEKIKAEGKIGKYNEAQTRTEFIEPLFEFLGWDMKNWNNPNEVTTEESVSNGRVDLAFRLSGIPKFFLEAKSLKSDLDIESYSRQAINYSWNKGVSWAVLTDFESLKLYNAQAKSKSLQDKLVFEIPYGEYLSDFDRLRLLSKESFQNNELDKYAEKYGKKLKKQTVNEKLYDDLRTAREILTKSFGIWNENVDKETLDEGVQRILDRLVFIRVLEDKGLEPPTLKPLVREWETDEKAKQLFPMLIEKFRELDEIYNSNLFMRHACEKWQEHDDSIKKVINLLYGTDMYEYDFKQIPADILGGVYESYLGYIAQNPIEADLGQKSGELFKVEGDKETKLKSRKKRKEQGIYYTPKYIVDYIIKETLGKKLEEVKSVHELKQLKILDPACGSGSFLTRALETINDKYKDFGNPGNQDAKTQILTENIHGVDLDSQAVELAKLNLLIDALDKKDKLPDLTENVRVGNSLISGSEDELKKYFGKNWRDKKPFNWDEEFSSVMKQGGFDVIIGNPPYIKEFVNKSVFDGLRHSPYYQGKMDIWTLFACKSVDLLKTNGLLSFIAPNNWISNAGSSIFRDKILKEGEIISYVDFGDYKIFDQAGIQTMIFVFQKKIPRKQYEVNYMRINDNKITEDHLTHSILKNRKIIFIEPNNLLGKSITFSETETASILEKINSKKNFSLFDKEVGQGIVAAPDKHFLVSNINHFNDDEKVFLKKYFTSSKRYNGGLSKNHIFYISEKNFGDKNIKQFPNIEKHFESSKNILRKAKIKYGTPNKPYFYLHRERDENFFKQGSKIVCGVRVAKPSFFFTNDEYYGSRALNFIKTERINLKYLVGILNSRLIFYWLINRGKRLGDLLQIDKGPLLNIPILKTDVKLQRAIIALVDKITELNIKIRSIPENSEKWKSMEKEIKKVDQEIDQKVYGLYGLTDDEIKVVEK